MIDWTKPIETVEDGQPTRVLGLLALAISGPPLPIEPDGPMMVWVESDRNGLGNIFLVDNRGFRCDDRALFSGRQEPFIRNVKVKRVAWCLVSPKYGIINRAAHFRTEELAQKAALKHEVVARLEWDE